MYISIITVNYNNSELLIDVLSRTMKALDGVKYEIVIIDNCSTDASYSELVHAYKDNESIKVVLSPKNGGFGFGCNLGVKHASADYLWFLNSDAWVEDCRGLEHVLAQLSIRTTGMIGTSVILASGEASPQGGGDMTFLYYLMSSFRLGKAFRLLPSSVRILIQPLIQLLPGSLGTYATSYSHASKGALYEVRGVGGASFLMQKDTYIRLGGFDDQFFLYDEDGDLCLRCIETGLTNYIAPSIRVHTYPSATTSSVPTLELKRIKRSSRVRLINKHFRGIERYLLQAVTRMTWRLL